MPLPQNYATARVVMRSPQKDAAINVLWWIADGETATPAQDAQALAGEIASVVAPAIKAVLCTSSAYVGVQVALKANGDIFTAFSNILSGNGSVVSDELPSYCAALIQKRTSGGGRQGRGRWYIPFVPEELVEESTFNAGTLALYDAVATAYAAAHNVNGVSYTPAHYSKFDDTLYAIQFTTVIPIMATQRRRRLRQSF